MRPYLKRKRKLHIPFVFTEVFPLLRIWEIINWNAEGEATLWKTVFGLLRDSQSWTIVQQDQYSQGLRSIDCPHQSLAWEGAPGKYYPLLINNDRQFCYRGKAEFDTITLGAGWIIVVSLSYYVMIILWVLGYNALLRYEGFENDSSLDFWCNICGSDIHPVGWCAASGKPLVPPRSE